MLRKSRLLIFVVFLLGLAGCASMETQEESIVVTGSRIKAQAAAGTLVDPTLLREELDIIKSQLLTIHPGPFSRTTQVEFESLFTLIKQSLNYPLSRSEFFLKVAPLMASLRDVHSFMNLPKDHMGDLSRRDERLFPLAVVLENDKFYVAADLSDSPLIPVGAELISVNKAPMSFLLDVMRSVTARETLSGQSRRIQLDFSWLLAAMGHSKTDYQIKYRSDNSIYEQSLKGLKTPKQQPDSEGLSYYGYSKVTPKTALLWLNDFNENPERFDEFLNDKFTQMEQYQLENLIIDVRYNQGGLSENLKNLLARLIHEPIHWADRGVIKVSEPLKLNHRSKTRARRVSKYKWGLQWFPFEWTDSLQHSIYWADLGETISLELDSIEPNNGYRPKNVWVLTNGFCYSACSFFVASVNHYGLAKTMGEQTGSLTRYQFAYPVQIELPHTGLIFTLPTMRLDFLNGDEAALITPHEIIQRTEKDIASRVDPVLNRALQEAERKPRSPKKSALNLGDDIK